jgi:hypothetical protein
MHRLFQLSQQLLFLSFEDETQRPDLFAVLFLGYAQVARRGALVNAMEKARPKPAPALIVGRNVERAGTELEDALQDL